MDRSHSEAEWERFMASARLARSYTRGTYKYGRAIPRLYDLNDRIGSRLSVHRERETYKTDGIDLHWHGIRDDSGRNMVAMGYNQHIGDAWEHADAPR